MKQGNFKPIEQLIFLNEFSQWDRTAMVGILERGKAEGVFTNISLV